jgi:putative tryptophan/tyrosine transport system substrate-binding protein
MKKRITFLTFCVMYFALCVPVCAQQARIPRIGYLAAEHGSSPPKDFVEALRDLGYVEGKNIAFEYRTSEGKTGAYPDLLADLIRLKVDIIVTSASGATLAAKQATNTIPVLMTSSTDPVGTGLVASLARPGGNITGLTSVTGELGGKFLELLKEIVPKVSRVLIPAPAGSITEDLFIKETEAPARALKIQTIRFPVRGPEDYQGIFRAAAKERANALVVRLPPSITPASQRKQFTALAAKHRLPAIYGTKVWVESGGLVSYGQDQNIKNRRLAVYVDKILKGAKPADLPIEAPIKFEFVINLKAAKQIGLTIPPNVLARADKVIK